MEELLLIVSTVKLGCIRQISQYAVSELELSET